MRALRAVGEDQADGLTGVQGGRGGDHDAVLALDPGEAGLGRSGVQAGQGAGEGGEPRLVAFQPAGQGDEAASDCLQPGRALVEAAMQGLGRQPGQGAEQTVLVRLHIGGEPGAQTGGDGLEAVAAALHGAVEQGRGQAAGDADKGALVQGDISREARRQPAAGVVEPLLRQGQDVLGPGGQAAGGGAQTGAAVLEDAAAGAGEAAVQALRGVDLDLPEGEMVVVLGASGSGKSTFLNILGGLDRPSGGEVLFRGRDISRSNDRQLTEYRRRHVGFVFQFYNLMPSLTARENVALVTEIAEAPLAPEEALAMVGLEDRLDHFPAQLSGGEQQRVAIARAVAKQPSVLLCDEPTGALDSATGVRVLEALRTVNDRLGATTLLITHNAGIAAIADRVVLFADGRVREVRVNRRKREPREISW